MHWDSPCQSRQVSNMILSDATDDTLNHLSQFQDRVLGYEHGARVEEIAVLSSKSASGCCRISVRSKLVSVLFPQEEMMVLFVWRCGLLTAGCSPSFFDHSVTVPCLDSRRVFPWLCELFSQGRCCPFLQQRIVPNRVFERRVDSKPYR